MVSYKDIYNAIIFDVVFTDGTSCKLTGAEVEERDLMSYENYKAVADVRACKEQPDPVVKDFLSKFHEFMEYYPNEWFFSDDYYDHIYSKQEVVFPRTVIITAVKTGESFSTKSYLDFCNYLNRKGFVFADVMQVLDRIETFASGKSYRLNNYKFHVVD